MASAFNKIINKMSDHPNASTQPHLSDADAGITSNNENHPHDPNRSETQNWIKSGQGTTRLGEDKIKAGSFTQDDITSPAMDQRVINSGFHKAVSQAGQGTGSN